MEFPAVVKVTCPKDDLPSIVKVDDKIFKVKD